MKAFQCSKCKHLKDCDSYCCCQAGIDIRPGHREKGDAEICKNEFESLKPGEEWHEKFKWE